jgi:adenosylcobinamide kinase/adenosylcobinamide-phosphate guanylyltransferase
MTRLYVDELGRLNQRVAAASTRVTMMVAGLPLVLKG